MCIRSEGIIRLTDSFINYTHIRVGMATKNISISEEAYKRLENLKHPNESFSVVISRLTGKRPLIDLFGVLCEEEADRLESNIRRVRSVRAKANRNRSKRMKEAFQ